MSFLSQIQNGVNLKRTEINQINDRSAANLALSAADVLSDEAARWQYFFDSGCSSWFEQIKAHTFTSTFCALKPAEARVRRARLTI